MQTLRPQRDIAPASAPRDAIDDAMLAPRPYVLPPADAPVAEPPPGASSTRGAVAPGTASSTGTRPDFSGGPASPAAGKPPAPAASSPPRPSGPTASPTGTPVTDPQLLKELQGATKAK